MEEMKRLELWTPELQELAPVVQQGLEANFAHVEVEVADCPDLRALGCAGEGICGSTVLLEVGGEQYAHNPKYRHVTFDMEQMARDCGQAAASIIGAGMAFPGVLNGHCGELIATMQSGQDNRSKVARVGPQKECIVEPYPSTRHSGLSNLFLSEGKPGKILKVRVEKRTGSEASFTQALRQSLLAHPQVGSTDAPGSTRQIGMGGVFVVEAGRVRSHIMPDYECIAHRYYDTQREEVIADFLQFYEHMGPELLCLSVFWTGDPSGGRMHLRPTGEHTHFFHLGERSEAGHYHHDVSPETIRYTGYFNTAAELVRIGDINAELDGLNCFPKKA